MKTREDTLIPYCIHLKDNNLLINRSFDPAYPGLDIEIVPNKETTSVSNPRILIEQNTETSIIRALIWDNPDEEDYTKEIQLYPAVNNDA